MLRIHIYLKRKKIMGIMTKLPNSQCKIIPTYIVHDYFKNYSSDLKCVRKHIISHVK